MVCISSLHLKYYFNTDDECKHDNNNSDEKGEIQEENLEHENINEPQESDYTSTFFFSCIQTIKCKEKFLKQMVTFKSKSKLE